MSMERKNEFIWSLVTGQNENGCVLSEECFHIGPSRLASMIHVGSPKRRFPKDLVESEAEIDF